MDDSDYDRTFNYPSLLRDDVEYLSESVPPAPHHRRLRSAENWERQIYDSEVHDQCRHHRLQAYTMRDVATISRGFSLVQKHDKTKTPNADTRTYLFVYLTVIIIVYFADKNFINITINTDTTAGHTTPQLSL